MKLVPVTIGLPEYTQAQEDTLATSLAGMASSPLSIIYNSTLSKERSWNGSAFINTPVISATILPFQLVGCATLTVGTATPSNPATNDLWIDTN